MDWKQNQKRSDLDKLGRAQLSQRYKNSAGHQSNEKKLPKDLHDTISSTFYIEGRKPKSMKFYANSTSMIGRQGILNWIDDIIKEIEFDSLTHSESI